MDRLSIKRMVGSEERVVAYAVNFEYSAKRMGECFVSVDVKSPTPIDFELGDYIEFRGERFVLTYSPSVVKQARKNTYGEAFSYSGIKFSGISDELTRVRMLDVVEGNNDVHYSQLPKFSFFCGTIDDFISRVQANLDRVYPNEWEVKAEAGAEIATNVEVSIDNKSVWEAMEIIATKFKSSFIVKQEKGKKKIIIGNVLSTGEKYGYGKGNGFLSIERSSESEQQIITRLRAYGSTKNLPAHYYTEPYDIEVRVDRIGERHGLPYLVSKEYKAGGLVTTDECVFLLPFNRPYSHTEQDILVGDVVRVSDGHRTPIRFNMSERKGVFGDVYTWLYVEGADIVRDFVFPKPEKVYTKAELDNMLQNGWKKSRNKKFLLFFKDKETGKKADERDISAMWDFLDEDGYPQSINDDDLRFHNNEVIGYFPSNVEVQQIEAVVYKDSPMTREYEYAEPAKYPSRCVAIPEDRAAYELLRKDGYHLILRGEIWKKPTQFQKIRWYSTTPTAPNNMAVNNLMLPAFLNYKARNEQGEERVLNPYLCEKVDENRVRYPKGSGEIYTIEEVIQDAYVEDAELIKKWGVREGCIYFDQEGEGAEFPEIYPTIQGVTRGEMKAAGYDVGNGDDSERIDELLGGSFQYYNDNGKVVNTEHETIKSQIKDDGNVTFGTQGIKKEEVNDTFYVLVKNMGFDLQAVVNGENTSIKMTDGMCGGREFQLLNQTGSNPKRYLDSNGNVYWRVALKRVWDENTKLWYPNSDYPIKDNDRFVMLGFDLPTPFIQAAEQRLEKAAKEYFASNSRSKYSYVPKIDPVFMAKDLVENGQNSLHHQLQVGMIIKFSDEDLNVDNANWSEKEKTNTRVTLFVDSLNIKYNDGKQPEYSISLKEEAEFSTLQKIHNQITALQTGVENISSPAKIKRYALASVNGHYLKKQEPDTANGHKTFNDGITSIGKTKMAGEAEVEGNLDVLGKTRAESFEVGPWRGGLLTGSGAKVDERGNAEVESIKVRSRMEVAELVVNRQTTMDADFLLTEGDLVENVKEEANGQFTLTLRREWEGDATSLTEGTVLRGIFNNITQGGATFETTWLKVLSVDTANNAIRVSLYPANECPAGVNHPPRKLLKISRWGHTTDATRQATYLLSSREQRVCLLTNVTKPIIDASNISSWQGKLDGLTWRDAGGQTHQLTGYGNVMGDAYVSGSLHVGGELTGAIADKVNDIANDVDKAKRAADDAKAKLAEIEVDALRDSIISDVEGKALAKAKLELLKSEKSYLLARANAVLKAHPQLATTHPTEYNQIREGSDSNQNAKWCYLLYAEGMINACEAFLAGNSSYIFNGGSEPTATRYEDLFSLWLSSKSLSEWYEFSRNSFESAIIMADRGKDGARGERGIPGERGADGRSSYTHIAYADTNQGGGFSQQPLGKAYMGVYVDNLPNDSNDPSRYKWSLIKGQKGDQGVQGASGADGRTPYFHTAYASSSDGRTNFHLSDPNGRSYIGVYTDYNLSDSQDPSQYKWSLIKGEDGLSLIRSVSLYLLTDSITEIPKLPESPHTLTENPNRGAWTTQRPSYSAGGRWHTSNVKGKGPRENTRNKPRVDVHGFWEVWDAINGRYVVTPHRYRGEDEINRLAPRIRKNGFWEIYDSSTHLWKCEEQAFGLIYGDGQVIELRYTEPQLDLSWEDLRDSRISGKNLYGFGKGITEEYVNLAPVETGTTKTFSVRTKFLDRPKPKVGSGKPLYGFRVEVDEVHSNQRDKSLHRDYRQSCILVRLYNLGLFELGDYAVSFKIRANRKIQSAIHEYHPERHEHRVTNKYRPTICVNLCDTPATYITPTEEWQEVRFVAHALLHLGGNPEHNPKHPTDPYDLKGFLDLEVRSGLLHWDESNSGEYFYGHLREGDWIEIDQLMIERGNVHTPFRPSMDYLTQLFSQSTGMKDGVVFGGRIDAQQDGKTKAFLNGVNLDSFPVLAADMQYDDHERPIGANVEIWANGHFKFGDKLSWNGENLNVDGIITAEEMRYKVMPFPSHTLSNHPAQINTGTLFINGGGFVEMPYLERGISREVRFILTGGQLLRPVVKDSRVKLRLDGRIKSQQPSVSFRFVRALGVNYGDDGNTYWYIHYDGEITKENIAYS